MQSSSARPYGAITIEHSYQQTENVEWKFK
jgi:hypothetical protein